MTQPTVTVASPAELLRAEMIDHFSDPTIVAGSTTHSASTSPEGSIGITQGGDMRVEPNLPNLAWIRLNIRCLHHEEMPAEALAQSVKAFLHQRGRRVITQPSNGSRYLIQQTLALGPSFGRDTQETFLGIVFCDMCLALDPL